MSAHAPLPVRKVVQQEGASPKTQPAGAQDGAHGATVPFGSAKLAPSTAGRCTLARSTHVWRTTRVHHRHTCVQARCSREVRVRIGTLLPISSGLFVVQCTTNKPKVMHNVHVRCLPLQLRRCLNKSDFHAPKE